MITLATLQGPNDDILHFRKGVTILFFPKFGHQIKLHGPEVPLASDPIVLVLSSFLHCHIRQVNKVVLDLINLGRIP